MVAAKIRFSASSWLIPSMPVICLNKTAMAAVAAEIMAGRPPKIEVMTAMEKEA